MRSFGLGATLARMDEAVGTYRTDPAFWMLYGQTTLDLFEEALAAGRTLGQLPQDAEVSFREALTLNPQDREARLGLARALRLEGQGEAAWKEALQTWSASLRHEDWRVPDLLEVGRSALAWTAERVNAGGGVPAAASTGVQALESAAKAGEAAAWLPLYDLYAWQNLFEAAADAAARGLSSGLAGDEIYGRLRGLGSHERNLQIGTLERVREARPEDPRLAWYLGEALFFQGQETRRAMDVLKSAEVLDRAEEAFTLAQSLEPSFAGSCEEWRHLLRVQRAWLYRDDGRLAEAAEAVAAALEAAPERLEAAPDPDSLRLAVDAVAADLFRSGRVADAAAFLRRICAAHDANGDWMNNLGFFLRELGVAAQEQGDPAAQDHFEESWLAYSRAVELAPEDARIVNDRALIAVYYLDEHWELAERELHRSIALGSQQLAEFPADVPLTEHRYVDEAVGDAWENLAYLQLIRRHQTDRVQEYLDESIQHYPFARRNGVALLRTRLAEVRREP